MRVTLCTLFDGHYHYGVAGLANSLVAAGYQGVLWVGHRGALPAWMLHSRGFDAVARMLQVTPEVTIRTIEMDPPVSLNYRKAELIKQVLQQLEPGADACAYVDPDIVVTCEWNDLAKWFTFDGVAVVEDIEGRLLASDPKRQEWIGYFASHDLRPVRDLDRYFNSGFVAVPRSRIDFADVWHETCEIVAAECGREVCQRKAGAPGALFHSTDEDALNFALMACNVRVDRHGPEAMGFAPNGRHLSHAVGAFKPWQGRHLRRALLGQPPVAASRWYFRFADGPLEPFSRYLLKRRRITLAIAGALGWIFSWVRHSPVLRKSHAIPRKPQADVSG